MKQGSESTLGCEGSAQRKCEQIWGGGGTQADLERLLPIEGWASAGVTGGMPKVFRTSKEARRAELSKNEGSKGKDRAGGAWGHSQQQGKGEKGGLTWSEVF